MRLYKLIFNKYTNSLRNTIGQKGTEIIQPHYITVENGVLYVAVSKIEELQWLDKYGDGIQIAEFLGGVMILEESLLTFNK